MTEAVTVADPATPPVVSVSDLHVTFARPDGSRFAVVRGVTLHVAAGEVVGIVGESGSGKSMTARSMMNLTPRGGAITGSLQIDGQEILGLSDEAMRRLRGSKVAMIFQDPMTSFNPVRRIGDQIGEAVAVHQRPSRDALDDAVVAALAQVGIINPEERRRAYPHEFSGGMRQRALIAMGIVNNPNLLIADEPTTALDVTVQDQILHLLRELNHSAGTAIVLITHNIAIVASICSRMVVMYAGCIVEDGPVERVLHDPQHPYTWMLLRSVPRIDVAIDRLVAIKGQPPDPADLPSGCKFHPRCPFAEDRCRQEEPALDAIGPEHRVRCLVLMRNVGDEERARA